MSRLERGVTTTIKYLAKHATEKRKDRSSNDATTVCARMVRWSGAAMEAKKDLDNCLGDQPIIRSVLVPLP